MNSNRHPRKACSVSTILILAIVCSISVAQSQQLTADPLTDNDRALIIDAVLYLDLRSQSSFPRFTTIRIVSDENIEFIERSSLSKHGFTLVGASELRESKKDRVVEYLRFETIHSRDQVVVVKVSRVAEGRPCFSAPISSSRSYTYEARRTPGGWVAQLISSPAHKLNFSTRVQSRAVEH